MPQYSLHPLRIHVLWEGMYRPSFLGHMHLGYISSGWFASALVMSAGLRRH